MDQPDPRVPKGHVRTRSGAKTSRPRSATKGPLDTDDIPLASPLGPASRLSQSGSRPSSPFSRSPIQSPRARALRSPTPTIGSPSVASHFDDQPRDFSFLLRPEIYHPLSALSVPAPFRSSPKQPTPDTPIPVLLARGHYRAAAIAAAAELTGVGGDPEAPASRPDPTDHARIFDLLYTRLACLTLSGATAVAAQEVRTLEDPAAPRYHDSVSGRHLWPWALRVLVVRLQALGFGDPRRAVMSYYDLAAEARARLAEANGISKDGNDDDGSAARELWRARLADLGVRVAGALVEMDDLAGAAHHLATLHHQNPNAANGSGATAVASALLWLHLGDVDAARRCVTPGAAGEATVAALCAMADGEYEAALARWEELRAGGSAVDEMVGVNTAVCMLYAGRMQNAKSLLEDLVGTGFSSHTLLFNLTTMYELCTDRSRALKLQLAERVSKMDESPMGWEKANADFKL